MAVRGPTASRMKAWILPRSLSVLAVLEEIWSLMTLSNFGTQVGADLGTPYLSLHFFLVGLLMHHMHEGILKELLGVL